MKKVIGWILLIGIIMIPWRVWGMSLISEREICGFYIRIEGEEIKDLPVYIIEDKEVKNSIYYRINAFMGVPIGEIDAVYEGGLEEYEGLDNQKKKNIYLLQYLGYNYCRDKYYSREATKWYAITQMLIWREIYGWDKVYLIDRIGGERIDTYDNDIREMLEEYTYFKNNVLERDVYHYNLFYNDSFVLDNIEAYDVYKSDFQYTNVDNSFKIDKVDKNGLVYLGKKDTNHRFDMKVVTFDDGNSIMMEGNIYYDIREYDLKVNKGTIDFSIKPINNVYSNEARLEGSCYGLFKGDSMIDEGCFDNEMLRYQFRDLDLGRYEIRPIKIGNGYETSNGIEIELVRGDYRKEVEVELFLIEGIIEIKKLVRVGGDEVELEESSFEVYDRDNNLVGMIDTDSNGRGRMNVGYGRYRLVQVRGSEGYQLVDEVECMVSERGTYELVLISDRMGDIKEDDEVIPDTGIDSRDDLLVYGNVLVCFVGTILFLWGRCQRQG